MCAYSVDREIQWRERDGIGGEVCIYSIYTYCVAVASPVEVLASEMQ